MNGWLEWTMNDRWTDDENFSNGWGGTDEWMTKIFEPIHGRWKFLYGWMADKNKYLNGWWG